MTKESRKRKKYIKHMQKDMAKACGMKRKELFGKNTPQSGASIAMDYAKVIEKERVKQAREWFEDDFREYLKKEHPEFDELEFPLRWDDLDEVFC